MDQCSKCEKGLDLEPVPVYLVVRGKLWGKDKPYCIPCFAEKYPKLADSVADYLIAGEVRLGEIFSRRTLEKTLAPVMKECSKADPRWCTKRLDQAVYVMFRDKPYCVACFAEEDRGVAGMVMGLLIMPRGS